MLSKLLKQVKGWFKEWFKPPKKQRTTTRKSTKTVLSTHKQSEETTRKSFTKVKSDIATMRAVLRAVQDELVNRLDALERTQTASGKDTNALKSSIESLRQREFASLQSTVSNIINELRRLDDVHTTTETNVQKLTQTITRVSEEHLPRLQRLEKLQQDKDDKFDKHWEWIQRHKDQMHEHKEQVLDLKSKIQSVERTLERLRTLADSSHNLEQLPDTVAMLAKKLAALESLGQRQPSLHNEVESSRPLAPRTPMPIASDPASIIKNLRPNERRVFGLLFKQFVDSNGTWVPFVTLRQHAYQTHDDTRIATSLLAKTLKPLYDAQLAEKQKQKNSAFLRPTRLGLDAAKALGMIEQKKKFDDLYQQLTA